MTAIVGKVEPISANGEPRQLNGERFDHQALCLATDAELEQVMRRGAPPDLQSLSGWEFRGFNTIVIADLLGIRKFKKGFYRETPSGYDVIQGYNVKIKQNPFGQPWIDVMKGADSFKFGWYNVARVRMTEPDYKYPNAVLINYDCSKNFALDPTRQLRDYLVQVYPDNPDLYLGKAYVALGPLRVFVSYFILERTNRSSLSA
jgi:hypothetical protein